MQPQQLGKYKIISKIGQGAMGEVYKALDPLFNRHVAIKTMSAAMGADDELRRRFLREAQSAALLSHPNIITVYDLGEEHGKIFMAMELLEGRDLKDLIAHKTPMTLEQKVSVMEQIADGLAFAHAREIVHRDLKPANIHIQPNGSVKIMDFGLARLASSEMTRVGTVMGTPNYMSPEQVRGEKADLRSDVFSLGAVYYELLGGKKPFEAPTLPAILFQVMDGQPEPLEALQPDLPPALCQVVAKALQKDASQRYQNAAQLRDAVRQVQAALFPKERPGGARPAAPAAGPAAPTTMPTAAVTAVPPPARAIPAPAPRVTGAVALEPAAAPAKALKPQAPPTLSGFSQTHVPLTEKAARPSPRNRAPLYAAGALALVVAGVVAWSLWRSGQHGGPAATPEASPVGAPSPAATAADGVRQQAAAQLALARRQLQDKSYAVAVAQAERILAADSGNAEARAIVEEGKTALLAVEQAVSQVRTALDSGDTRAASRALSKLLALDPEHLAVPEFTSRLNGVFKSQAQEARRGMDAARKAADGAKAAGQPEFVAAAAMARDADSLFRKQEYAAAARKYAAAGDGFERARRAAELAAIPPPAPAPTPVPEPAAPTPAPPADPAAEAEAAIRQVIASYERALETRDAGLFKSIKPNLSGSEERRLRDLAAQEVDISIVSLRVAGDKATVKLSRRDVTDGKVVAAQQTLELVKQSGSWVIKKIGR